MADKLVTVAEYDDSIKAELTKQLLEDFDIRAIVVDRNAANLGLPASFATVKVQVLEKDAARAAEILASTDGEFEVDEAGEFEGPDDDEPQWTEEQEGL